MGLLPPLLAILAFLALTLDRQGFRDLRLGRGLLLWWGVVVLWLGPAMVLGGDPYSQDILLRQNVTRYVNPWGHYQPPWYFLQVLPVDFLPWSLFVPAAIVGGRALDRRATASPAVPGLLGGGDGALLQRVAGKADGVRPHLLPGARALHRRRAGRAVAARAR